MSGFITVSEVSMSEAELIPSEVKGDELCKYNFIIKEAHKVVTSEFYRDTVIDRSMTLCNNWSYSHFTLVSYAFFFFLRGAIESSVIHRELTTLSSR